MLLSSLECICSWCQLTSNVHSIPLGMSGIDRDRNSVTLSIGWRVVCQTSFLANGILYLPYTVLAPSGAGLVIQAVQASTGTLRWKKHLGQAGSSSLAIVDGTTASTVFAESSESQHTPLMGLGAGDGATLW